MTHRTMPIIAITKHPCASELSLSMLFDASDTRDDVHGLVSWWFSWLVARGCVTSTLHHRDTTKPHDSQVESKTLYHALDRIFNTLAHPQSKTPGNTLLGTLIVGFGETSSADELFSSANVFRVG